VVGAVDSLFVSAAEEVEDVPHDAARAAAARRREVRAARPGVGERVVFPDVRGGSAGMVADVSADEPEVCERISLLYSEILTDEVGHVGYCASRCSRAERAIMRRLYPFIARLFARQTAEISLLVDRDELRARLSRPFDVNELTAGLTNETYLLTHP